MRLAKMTDFVARMPLFLLLLVFLLALAVVYSLIQSTYPFTVAVGNATMVLGIVLLALSWAIHLKKDGVRLFSHKKQGQDKPPESWAERTQGFGTPPAPPFPIPPDGMTPDSPEYRNLAAAELALRRKMMGNDDAASEGSDQSRDHGWNQDDDRGTVTANGGASRPIQSKKSKPAGSLALAGCLLFLLGIVFQYLVPVVY
jgi:hypothetical protein